MRAELEALAEKYRAMIALRRERPSAGDRRVRALAARFPGALRELDTRTTSALEARLGELDDALATGTSPRWAEIQSRFHGWMRVALRMRAEGAGDLASARAWAETYAPRDPGDPPRAALDDARLASLVDPPRGRISLAARDALEVGELDVDALLFGTR